MAELTQATAAKAAVTEHAAGGVPDGGAAGHDAADAGAPKRDVQVTDKALARIRVAMEKEGISPAEGGLRLGVLGGGCSGLSYTVRFDTKPRERDRVYDYDGVRIFVDPKSFIYLNGMVLDYEETLMRRGFNFINPNSSKSCGCGSSFSA